MAPRSQVYGSHLTVPVLQLPRAQRVDVSSGIHALAETVEQVEHRRTNEKTLEFATGLEGLKAEAEALPWDQRQAHFDNGLKKLRMKIEEGFNVWERANPEIVGEVRTSFDKIALLTGVDVKSSVEKGRKAHNINVLETTLADFQRNASLAESPAQRAFWLEEVGRAVGSARLSKSIDGDQADAYMLSINRNVDLAKATRLINDDPRAAVEVLTTPENFPSLNGLQILRLREDASNEATQRDARARQETAAKSSVVGSGLEVGINRFRNGQSNEFGQSDLEAARENLTPEHFNKLQMQYDDARAIRANEVQGRVNIAEMIASGRHVDPGDKAQVKAFDSYFQETLLPQMRAEVSDLPPEQQGDEINRRVLSLIRQQGIVPPSMMSGIRTALRSGNAAQKIDAAKSLDQIKAVNPQAIEDFDKRDIRAGNLIGSFVDAGMNPEAAVRAADDIMRQPVDLSDELDRRFAAEVKDDTTADWLSSKMAGWIYSPTVGVAVATEVDRLVRAEYQRNGGNLEAARRSALDSVKSRYGTSEVNGGFEIMRNPPERAYGVQWKSASENATAIREEALKDVTTGGATDGQLTVDDIRISPYPIKGITAPDGRPVYTLQVRDSGGGWSPQIDVNPNSPTHGLPLPWWPSMSKPKLEREEEIKRSIDDAKKKRAGWKGAGGPGMTDEDWRRKVAQEEADDPNTEAMRAQGAQWRKAHGYPDKSPSKGPEEAKRAYEEGNAQIAAMRGDAGVGVEAEGAITEEQLVKDADKYRGANAPKHLTRAEASGILLSALKREKAKTGKPTKAQAAQQRNALLTLLQLVEEDSASPQ